jgi:NAD(P)-dependent dehydrogenase (short-subunit alcohol dehydrogenase family)
MSAWLVTGASTGIGASVATSLRNQGESVLTLDIRDGDIVTDLSDPIQRQAAIETVSQGHSSLKGIVTCAGIASHIRDTAKIVSVNYFGTVQLIDGLEPLLDKGARIVAISSNSAPQSTNEQLVASMLNGDEEAARSVAESVSGHEAYASSKQAVARWVRRRAPELARHGVNLNAIAPGYIETPMTQAVAEDPQLGDAIKQFVGSIPLGRPGLPSDVNALIQFLLSDAASFIAGSVIFIDGGHDAMFRPDAV